MKLQHKNEALRQREKLLTNMEHKEETEETNKERKEQLQKEEQRKKDFELVVKTLKTQTQGLGKLYEGLKKVVVEMEREKFETEQKVNSVERQAKSDKAKGFIELKEIILRHIANERKGNIENLSLELEGLQVQANNTLKDLNMDSLDNQENVSS